MNEQNSIMPEGTEPPSGRWAMAIGVQSRDQTPGAAVGWGKD